MATKKTDDDIAFIEALAGVLKTNDLTEIEVDRDYGKDNALKVRVSRSAQTIPHTSAIVAAPPQPLAAPMVESTTTSAPEPASAAASITDPADHAGAVTSPMVGTAYMQPEPGAPSFVKIGDQVVQDQTLLIVEAMKTLNPILAHKSGKIRRILVEDGQAVEFGTPLMIIE